MNLVLKFNNGAKVAILSPKGIPATDADINRLKVIAKAKGWRVR